MDNSEKRILINRIIHSKFPQKAVSIGISTILSSKKIVLVATGENKAEIVSKIIKSKPSPLIPASLLKRHPKVLFILDKASASKIKKAMCHHALKGVV